MADPLGSGPLVHDGVTLAPTPMVGRYSLRTRTPIDLPPILRAAPLGGGHALGLGPDEWLLIQPAQEPAPVIEGVHALVDIGHRQIGLTISGAKAATLLRCGVALDLALPAFPVNKVTRTLHEGVEIVLWRTDEDAFHVEVWRSFAEHLFASLALNAGDL